MKLEFQNKSLPALFYKQYKNITVMKNDFLLHIFFKIDFFSLI